MEITLFSPHKGQKAVIDGFANSEHKFCIVSCGRQFGKSLLGQNLMLYWLLQSKSKGAWISPVYKQCQKIFEELVNASHQIIKQANKADLKITFINGSTLQFLSTDNYDTIRGYSFDYAILDEAAYIKEQAVNEAILPTLSALGKKCLILSTPRSKNWFYNWHVRGRTPNKTYISFEGKSIDNPYVDPEFIESQKQSLPTEIFKQEYEAIFSEATNDVFRNLDLVCILNEWNEPEPNRRYYAGIDTAISNDYSVCAIFDDQGQTARIIRINGQSLDEIGDTFKYYLKRYAVKSTYIETNGMGQGMFELIRKAGIKTTAFTTTNESKTRGVRKLLNDIEVAEVLLPSKELMPECYNEMSSYTYKISANGTISFSHPNGLHDDIVDALWLGNLARTNDSFSGSDVSSKIYIGNPKNFNVKFG